MTALLRTVVAALTVIPVLAPPAPGQAPRTAADLDIDVNVRIPLRDGIELSATIYVPKGPRIPRPVILAMTPYIADRYHGYVVPIARRGYVVAVVDVRGRGSSGGEFHPFAQEAKDGYDTVEWLARQPWSNGKVGMMGGSYGGFNQWSILKEFPPHLVSIAPTAAAHTGVDFPVNGGVSGKYMIQWLTLVTGRAPNNTLFGDGGFWTAKARETYLRHVPFAKLDSAVGNPSPIFQRWLRHPDYDEYWQAMNPSPAELTRVTIPIFTRTGMYDGDQVGAMEHYRKHMKHGSPEARARHYLMIGPWDHGGTRSPSKRFGGLTFGDSSLIDMESLEADWYDWTMGSGPRPKLLPKRVAYYVTGAEVWKHADSLEELGRDPTRFYLTSSGDGARDVFASGSLRPERPAAAAPDRWRNDPLDTTPGEHEPAESDYTDQRPALELGGRGAVYHTAPFERDTEVTGFPTLSLWLVSTVPDADLEAIISEITADGRSILLDDASLRTRYRESLSAPVLMTPGKPTRIDFVRFRFMSRRIAAGSRIRLLIRSVNSIGVERNYQSGGAVAFETAKDARVGEFSLLHEGEHWSVLELPIAR